MTFKGFTRFCFCYVFAINFFVGIFSKADMQISGPNFIKLPSRNNPQFVCTSDMFVFNITWFLNGDLVTNNEFVFVSTYARNTSILTLLNVNKMVAVERTETFTCVGHYGGEDEEFVIREVRISRNSFLKKEICPDRQMLLLSRPSVLICKYTATERDLEIDVLWFLPNGSSVRILSSRVINFVDLGLLFRNVTRDLDGTYKVQIHAMSENQEIEAVRIGVTLETSSHGGLARARAPDACLRPCDVGRSAQLHTTHDVSRSDLLFARRYSGEG